MLRDMSSAFIIMGYGTLVRSVWQGKGLVSWGRLAGADAVGDDDACFDEAVEIVAEASFFEDLAGVGTGAGGGVARPDGGAGEAWGRTAGGDKTEVLVFAGEAEAVGLHPWVVHEFADIGDDALSADTDLAQAGDP